MKTVRSRIVGLATGFLIASSPTFTACNVLAMGLSHHEFKVKGFDDRTGKRDGASREDLLKAFIMFNPSSQVDEYINILGIPESCAHHVNRVMALLNTYDDEAAD